MKEAVGLFTDMDSLQEAIKELEATDFPRDALSVLGSKDDLENKFGLASVRPELAEAYNDTPREAPPRSEEKAIGAGALISGSAYIGAMGVALAAGAVTVPAIIAAAAIGGLGGAAFGGALVKIMGDHYNEEIEDQIKKGGLLLWVRTPDEERERMACKILESYGAHHVKVHEIPQE